MKSSKRKPTPKAKASKTASCKRYLHPSFWWVERKLWQRIALVVLAILIFIVGSMYGISQWYVWKHRNEPVTFGATFSPEYAAYFGLDPKETMNAMINDLGIHSFRLVSYWADIEKTPGTYDFSQLDWQFKMAEASNAKISLAIGLRQPRWPECHEPDWVDNLTKDQWYPKLKDVTKATIERYKSSPALESYQLENEFFLSVFGECKDFDRNRLIDEFNYVKSLDTQHKVIISRSNNAVGLPLGEPRPDEFGVSVYKRVWDKTITKRYFEYPFPAWFYGFLAGAGEIMTGKDMIIHELQAEAWLPNGFNMKTAPSSEMYKSMNPQRLKDRMEYGRATGMKEIDLWGVEWWYYMKQVRHEPGLWDTARTELVKYRNDNGIN